MASNLPAAVNVGQINACLIRAALLAPDCSPLGGDDSAFVTVGLATFSSEPEVEEGTVYEPKTACGDIFYTYERDDKIKRYNLSGELLVFDVEGMFILFGGEVLEGRTGGPFAGQNIGWASPDYTSPQRNGVYLEIITQNIEQGAGDCISDDGGVPAYTGHIWGKAKLTLGSRTFEEDYARLAFTGKAVRNPRLFDGPWNDSPVEGYLSASPYQQVGYSADQYEAILATAAPGWQASAPAS